MFLCKDFDGSRIFYYWVRPGQPAKKISKNLASLALAQEWYLQFMHSLYAGVERRNRVTDRRFRPQRRKDISRSMERDRRQQTGRRDTDKPIEIAFDIAANKLKRHLSRCGSSD